MFPPWVPDVAVEISESQFLKGDDPQLRKAMELLRQEIGKRPAGTQSAAGK